MNLDTILSRKNLYSVFQPVVSFTTGDVFGYEALSRTETDVFSGPITELFSAAEAADRLWELDKLCRKTAIQTARSLGLRNRLFLNINPESMYERDFQEGFTRRLLEKYGINPAELVLEITEHPEPAGGHTVSLKDAVDYYRRQGYQIALDDVGSAYSGLQRVCSLNPDFIKIDMTIIRGIESDPVRQAMVRSLVSFCTSSGAGLIAEGIETAAELNKLLALGVTYGQGFFLARPGRTFVRTTGESYVRIITHLHNSRTLAGQGTTVPAVPVAHAAVHPAAPLRRGAVPAQAAPAVTAQSVLRLAVPGITVLADTPVMTLNELFQSHTDCQLVTITGTDGTVQGIMPRALLLDLFASQYGYSLHAHKQIGELMITGFLVVDAGESVEQVASRATARAEENLYDPVIVTRNGQYAGVVTVKGLLESIVNVEVTGRTREINRKNRMLQEQQLVHDRDMHMAELVQKSFYPAAAPQTTDWECAFTFRPMASVSGDVYDFYYDRTGNLSGAALFDVSGHGVASGLVGILSKYIAEQVFSSHTDKPLDEMIAAFHTLLSKEKGLVENYLTGIFLRIRGNTVEYVNAGHTDVLMKTADTVTTLGEDVHNFRGPFIGIDGLPGSCQTVTTGLSDETYFLLYTDCLTESRNLAGDELGAERLRKIFARASAGSAQTVLTHIIETFEAFTEAVPLRDDLTVIVMKYRSGQGVRR
jgi:EAL domain-containing protein (putative c-di-GMP-specific phosphodiesterase class I)/serine phosphatase RsbU (regulator of sigma subunit)